MTQSINTAGVNAGITERGDTMDQCEYLDECRNAQNNIKCDKCEHNPNNYEKMQKDGYDGDAHDQRGKSFYIFRDNYDPL